MKTSELKIGDRVKVTDSIVGTVIEITKNGWVKLAWSFNSFKGCLIHFPEEFGPQIDSFRASQIERIIQTDELF